MSTTGTTFAKLRDGSWGVRGKGLSVGMTVSVRKRDGSATTVTITRVLSSGADGTQLCAIESDRKRGSASASETATERRYKRQYGWDGRRDSPSYYSSGMYDEES